MAHSSMTKTSPISVTPQSGSRVAHFDFLFSAILNNFLDGATRQIQGKSRAMSKEMASICANIACSPADCCALIKVALKSIPFSIKEAFGRPPWSWQLVGNMKDATHKTLGLATGVYAYHLTNINSQDEQNFYVGQTTRSFASRWAEHARHRKAAKRAEESSSNFYTNLKMTRTKDINIFILADISNFQEDVVAHKVMAGILEAGFCVFFDSLRHKPPGSLEFGPGSKDSISFAHRWSVVSSLAVFPSHCLAFPQSSIQYACRTMAGHEFCISTVPVHATQTLAGRGDGYSVTNRGEPRMPCAFARETGKGGL